MKNTLFAFAMFLLLTLVHGGQPTLTINGIAPTEQPTVTGQQWSFQYARKLTDKKALAPELKLNEKRWKQHAKHAYITGCNGPITLKIQAGTPIETLKATTKVTNYADSARRTLAIAYSVNGEDFIELADAEFGSGAQPLSGGLKLPKNQGTIWVRYLLHWDKKDTNGRFGFVLFQNLSLELSGPCQTN